MPSFLKKEDAILLYSKIYDFDNLLEAYKNTQKGNRKYKNESLVFRPFYLSNLKQIQEELRLGTYIPSDYISFYVHEPKERLIHAPTLRDKIVQFSTHKVLQDIYEPVFYKHSYACLLGRGQHRAAKRVQRNLHINPNRWIIKIDVKKFFYSINRDILKKVLRKKIRCLILLNHLDKIIDSSPCGDKGIPLGNVTSQDFANILLNEVDQYITRYLGIRYYVRFMDDLILVVNSKKEAQENLVKIKNFLYSRLDLETNNKTKIFPVKQGVNAYGYKIYKNHMKLRDSSKNKMKRKIRKMDQKLENSEITLKEVQQSVSSWIGHAKHANSYGLIIHIFKDYPYLETITIEKGDT